MKDILEELAFNILLEGKFETLPLKITHLAKINKVDYLNDFSRDKFTNCIEICEFILKSKNLDADRLQAEQLAILIMAPKCILEACKVTSAENLHILTALPIKTATRVFNTLYHQNTNTVFGEKEKQVMQQFQPFIHQQLGHKPHFHE